MTQEKIAEALNLSRRTVARALKGDPKISEETKAAVLKYCESVGYKKNRIGSLLASPPRTVNAYLLVSTNENYLSHTSDGIFEAQKQIGPEKIKFNIFHNNINDSDSQVKILEETLKKDRPDGIIVIPTDNERIAKVLDEYDFHNVVTIDKPLSADITHIGSDFGKFGELAAQMMELTRRQEEPLLVINTNSDKISSDKYYAAFMEELSKIKAVNYDVIYIEDIRNNMNKILEYESLGDISYIFAPRFLPEIINYLDGRNYKSIKYAACSINDTLIEMIRAGKVISGININYHLHGYLAAKAAFNIINTDWRPIHYITNNQIIIKGNVDSLDDNNIVGMQTLFNIL